MPSLHTSLNRSPSAAQGQGHRHSAWPRPAPGPHRATPHLPAAPRAAHLLAPARSLQPSTGLPISPSSHRSFSSQPLVSGKAASLSRAAAALGAGAEAAAAARAAQSAASASAGGASDPTAPAGGVEGDGDAAGRTGKESDTSSSNRQWSSSSSSSSWSSSSSPSTSPPEPRPGRQPPPVILSPVALRVVVIGWMGSNRRYLNKYGSMWARSGDHEVLVLRPSVAQTLVRWRGVVVAGRDIDRVARLHRENPAMPTVYHIFSTGGFIHAGTMWRWMDEVEDVAQRRDMLEEVRGIIFDSAPAAVNPYMASRAIVSALTHTPAEELVHGSTPGLKGALLSGTRSFLDAYLRTKGVKLREEEVYDAWYHLAPTCPQLYLYSSADPLVPAADVERYMEVQEGRGVDVSCYRWADSGHVDHMRRHPAEYAYQVSAFLARALRDW